MLRMNNLISKEDFEMYDIRSIFNVNSLNFLACFFILVFLHFFSILLSTQFFSYVLIQCLWHCLTENLINFYDFMLQR